MSGSRRALAAGAAAALVVIPATGSGAATAPATTSLPPFTVVATKAVGGAPTRIAFGYGAAWTLNTNGSVSRVDAATGQVVTTSVGPNPRDIRAAYNSVWVLRSTKTTATLNRLQPGNGKPTGKAISVPLGTTVSSGSTPTGGNTLGVGSNMVWVAGVGTWSKLAAVNPGTGAVRIKSWPMPRAFTVAAGAVWDIAGSSAPLQKRNPSTLAIQASFPTGAAGGGSAGWAGMTYGAGALWLTQVMPNDDGLIVKASPTTGLVPPVMSVGQNIELRCVSVGANAVWATQGFDRLSSAPAVLMELSQADLRELGRETLPPGSSTGAVNCVVAGGGLVWVTDGVGAVYEIQP